MNWGSRAMSLLVLAGAGCIGISCGKGPQTSETKTNWLEVCEISADCEDGVSCLCGLCSAPCDSDSACGDGVCGSAIDTESQCRHGATATIPERMCLAAGDECGAGSLGDEEPIVALDFTGPAAVNCPYSQALFCEDFSAPLGNHYQGLGDLQSQPTFISDCRAPTGDSGPAHPGC